MTAVRAESEVVTSNNVVNNNSHFSDRQALLDALAEAGFVRLGAELRAAIDQAADEFEPRLQATASAYVRFATRDGALLELMFAGKHRQPSDAVQTVPWCRGSPRSSAAASSTPRSRTNWWPTRSPSSAGTHPAPPRSGVGARCRDRGQVGEILRGRRRAKETSANEAEERPQVVHEHARAASRASRCPAARLASGRSPDGRRSRSTPRTSRRSTRTARPVSRAGRSRASAAASTVAWSSRCPSGGASRSRPAPPARRRSAPRLH